MYIHLQHTSKWILYVDSWSQSASSKCLKHVPKIPKERIKKKYKKGAHGRKEHMEHMDRVPSWALHLPSNPQLEHMDWEAGLMLDHRLAPTPGRIGCCNGHKMSQGLSHLSHLSLSKFQESPLRSQELPPTTKSNRIQSTNGLGTWWRLRAPAGSLGGTRGLPWHAQKRHHRSQSIRSRQISDRIVRSQSVKSKMYLRC